MESLVTIITKKEILEKWDARAKPENFLWGVQARINYETIKNNSPKKALEILKKDYEAHKEMSLSSFILEAIEDVQSIGKEVSV